MKNFACVIYKSFNIYLIFFNKIRSFTTTINVVFRHELRMANSMADVLAK